MIVVCSHCNKVLKPEDGRKPIGKKSHSMCIGYGKPCPKNKRYLKQVAKNLGTSYELFIANKKTG